jgi:hypothetical protein
MWSGMNQLYVPKIHTKEKKYKYVIATLNTILDVFPHYSKYRQSSEGQM